MLYGVDSVPVERSLVADDVDDSLTFLISLPVVLQNASAANAGRYIRIARRTKGNRAGGIRTRDLLNPIQAHYQAVLRPDVRALSAAPCQPAKQTFAAAAGTSLRPRSGAGEQLNVQVTSRRIARCSKLSVVDVLPHRQS